MHLIGSRAPGLTIHSFMSEFDTRIFFGLTPEHHRAVDERLGLSAAERAEVNARPIDPQRRTDFTDEQFALRESIGKKLLDHVLRTDESITPEVRRGYEECPTWAFYTSEPHGKGLPRRVFGVFTVEDETKGKSIHLHAVSSHMLWNNIIVGGLPLEETRALRVPRLYMKNVFLGATPGLFIDPLGFLMFGLGEKDNSLGGCCAACGHCPQCGQ